MPFSTRLVPARTQVPEIYQGHAAQNILEKNSVSNMIGVLQQLNLISNYASEVFGDIFAMTEKNHQRIIKVKERLSGLEQRVPSQEQLLSQNSPMFFYDNPYMGSEFQRKDPNQGLLFRRDRCTLEVNRQRAHAQAIPDFSSLDRFSADGQPNATKYSDSRFFINEWLAAEERKIKEEKRKRKQMRAERKANRLAKSGGKIKRTKTTQVLAVATRRYDPNTGKLIVEEEKQFANVADFTLSDNSVKGSGGKRESVKPGKGKPGKAGKAKSPPVGAQSPQVAQAAPQGGQGVGGPPQAPPQAMVQQQQQQQYQAQQARAQQSMAPQGMQQRQPPVPVMPMGGGGPGGPGPPPPPNAAFMAPPQAHERSNPSYGGFDAGPQMDNGHGSVMSQPPPVQQVAPARPAFMRDLLGDAVKNSLKPTPKVERVVQVDSRSAMIKALQGNKGKAKLKRVDTEAIAAQKAAEHKDESMLVNELMKRRAYLEDDDDDDETDSDWDDSDY